MFDKLKFEQITASIEGGANTLDQAVAKQQSLADAVTAAQTAQDEGKIELELAGEAYDQAVAAGEEYLKSLERHPVDSPPADLPTGSPDSTDTAQPLA